MSSFGERLRNERKARGIGLSAIAEATKISKSSLRALESNRFHELPGGVFNRGFVRAIAEFIGIDPEEMVAAYEIEERDQERHRLEAEAGTPAGAQPGRPGSATEAKPRNRRLLILIFLLAALGAVALAAWLARPETPPGTAAPEVSPPRATTVQPPVIPPPPPPERSAESSQATEQGVDTEEGPPSPAPVEPAQDEEQAAGEEIPPPVTEEPPPAPAPVEPTAEVEEPPGEPTDPVASPPGTLSVSESGVGTRVVNRRLEGRTNAFSEGDRVWFWTRVLGGEPGQKIQHVWVREGAPVSSVEIVLGGTHWRAHTWKTMYPGSAGQWRAEVQDAEGRILASEEFVCERP